MVEPTFVQTDYEELKETHWNVGRYYIKKRVVALFILFIVFIALILLLINLVFIHPPGWVNNWLNRNTPLVRYTEFVNPEQCLKKFTGKVRIKDKQNRVIYEGDLEKGLYHGKGNLTNHLRGYIYEGEFVEGKKKGQGVLYKFSSNTKEKEIIYKGAFENDSYSGQGTLYEKSLTYCKEAKEISQRYEGTFKNGKKDGEGKYFYSNGEICYEGGFRNDSFYGKGTLYYDNGQKKYEGSFMNNVYSGQGELYFDNGQINLKGNFFKGEITGEGQQFSQNGYVVYQGKLASGLAMGLGTLYDDNEIPLYKGMFLLGFPSYHSFLGMNNKQIEQILGKPDEQLTSNQQVITATPSVTEATYSTYDPSILATDSNTSIKLRYSAYSMEFTLSQDLRNPDNWYISSINIWGAPLQRINSYFVYKQTQNGKLFQQTFKPTFIDDKYESPYYITRYQLNDHSTFAFYEDVEDHMPIRLIISKEDLSDRSEIEELG